MVKQKEPRRDNNTDACGVAGTTVLKAAPPVEPITIRPRAAAAVIGVGHSKLWELIHDGELKVSRIGRVTLVHVDSIRELIARTTAN